MRKIFQFICFVRSIILKTGFPLRMFREFVSIYTTNATGIKCFRLYRTWKWAAMMSQNYHSKTCSINVLQLQLLRSKFPYSIRCGFLPSMIYIPCAGLLRSAARTPHRDKHRRGLLPPRAPCLPLSPSGRGQIGPYCTTPPVLAYVGGN